MPLVTPDFTGTSDEVGPGTYKVRVTGAKMDEREKDDKKIPLVVWTMDTFGEAEEKNNGRKVWYRTDLSGEWAKKLKSFYKAATGEELDGPFDTDMLMGKELQVTLAERNNYIEVKSVSPLM